MKVLFISHRLPFPPNKGDKIRAFNIIAHLSRDHEVHLATLIDDEADLSQLGDAGRAVASLSYERIDNVSRAQKALKSLITGRSISQEYFYSRALQEKVDALLAEHEFGLVFCSSSPTAEYIYRSRKPFSPDSGPMRIMDFIDIDSVKWRQYAESANLFMRWIYVRESMKLAALESRIGADFDKMLVVSPSEAELFPAEQHSQKMCAIGNGVDLDYFSPSTDYEARSRPTLVFVGMMDYLPNIDGMQWFIDTILPLIRKSIPECCVQIVGGRPAPTVQSWGQIENVEVTGFVTDIREYLHRGSLSIVPLRIARGIQNKVLEAMATGKAIVATPQALEGIEAKPGKDVVVADSADDFARAVIELLQAPDRALEIGAAARSCVERRYSWSGRLQSLDALLDEYAAIASPGSGE